MTNRIRSEVRGPGLISPMARIEYRALTEGQPLLLEREPANPVDPNAVIVKTFLQQPCGYLAKEHAAIVSPDMARGEMWLCKVTAKANATHCPQVLLWKERRTTASVTQTRQRERA